MSEFIYAFIILYVIYTLCHFFNYIYTEHKIKIENLKWAQKKQFEMMYCNNDLYIDMYLNGKS
jgi:hypothetical protein